ncbi:hypothetical protein G5C60_31195 [Streptomyces sp. HC44]|uniref:Lipoprotein n=1 Tax=Streptomyces scabichelini TaxID=2711217 RepID=A0A6G4VDA3_9ACTN|nr:hypothetical protein [Streptomyces scabichelini]NGO11951.1 hypothetical protein [Streptomyces scabichelini]
MNHRPSHRPPRRRVRPAPVLASALAAGVLLTTATSCSGGDSEAGGSAGSAVSPVAAQAPTTSPSASAAPAFTEAQAKAALIGQADLGEDWVPTQGAATWRDGLLKGATDVADCQRLLDGLYAEDLLGEPTGARAVTGFDNNDDRGDGDDGADSDDTDDFDDEEQLRYQVAAYDRAALDKSLAWLKELPAKCAEFTSTDSRGGQRTVAVASSPLPAVGEAREGLRMTMTGETNTLTLDFTAVRIGDNALTFTYGGLDTPDSASTTQATRLGALRLQKALKD